MKIDNLAKATFETAVVLFALAAGLTTLSTSAHAQSGPAAMQAWVDSQVEASANAVENVVAQQERRCGIDPRTTANLSNNARLRNLLNECMDRMTPEELIAAGNRAEGMNRIASVQNNISDDIQRSNAEIARQNSVDQARSYRDYYDNAARYYISIGDGWDAQNAINAANTWRARVQQQNGGRD
jgi:hypothetical protein